MVNVINMGPIACREYLKNKKVIVFGAGRALESCIDLYFDNKEIEIIVDNNSKIWGSHIEHCGRMVQIVGVHDLVKILVGKSLDDYVMMITSPFYAAEIVHQLDKYAEFDGLCCFLQVVVRNTRENIWPYSFTKGQEQIPRKIHYFWIGGKPLPEEFEANIDTWKKQNPDFEIIRWDESNYDFGKCDYMRECMESGQWSFATNYARLDVLHAEGGIYLDTDVVAKASFAPLLADKAFFNMGCADRINMGCGFGAQAGTEIVGQMKETMEKGHFVDQFGKPMKKPFHSYIHPVLKKVGFVFENKYQNIDDVAIYPCEVMSPITMEGMQDFISEKTISMHLETRTWTTEREREGQQNIARLINERLK